MRRILTVNQNEFIESLFLNIGTNKERKKENGEKGKRGLQVYDMDTSELGEGDRDTLVGGGDELAWLG